MAVVCHSSAAAQQRQTRLPTKFTNSRAQQLEGAGVPYEPLPESLQRIMEESWKISTTRFSPTWSSMVRSERTSDLRRQNSDE